MSLKLAKLVGSHLESFKPGKRNRRKFSKSFKQPAKSSKVVRSSENSLKTQQNIVGILKAEFKNRQKIVTSP